MVSMVWFSVDAPGEQPDRRSADPGRGAHVEGTLHGVRQHQCHRPPHPAHYP